jgi:hypothetical protein
MTKKSSKKNNQKSRKMVQHTKSKNPIGLKSHDSLNSSEFKKELLESDTMKSRYNKLFEQKLGEQYKEFRHIKEHNMQMRRFVRIVMVIIVIIIITLVLLMFGQL